MLCWILIVGGLLIMMGQHDRSEALFYYFREHTSLICVIEVARGQHCESCRIIDTHGASE